jgi:O-acetyl-ADP-ribose deacetylase (regulator of RNase III)
MGDITDEHTEAIVNAANGFLAHSGGVAAAILRAGGSNIQVESTNLVNVNGPVPVGECVYTGSGLLARQGVKYVIHSVGPEYNKNKSALANSILLYNAIFNALIVANKLTCTSIALPAISSGIFGFPKHLCASIFFCAIKDFIMSESDQRVNGRVFLKKIRLVNYDKETSTIFRDEFNTFCSDKQSSVEGKMLSTSPDFEASSNKKDIFTHSFNGKPSTYKAVMPNDTVSESESVHETSVSQHTR